MTEAFIRDILSAYFLFDGCDMSVALVVSSVDSKALTQLLLGIGITSVPLFDSAAAARRGMEQLDPDFVIINQPLSDDNGVDLSLYAAQNTLAATILFVDGDFNMQYKKLIESRGVLVMKKPVSSDKVLNVIKYISALRYNVNSIRAENAELKAKLEETRIVDRAKLLLVQYLGMSEKEAHRHIEKKAMDNRITKSQVAKEIIKIYES